MNQVVDKIKSKCTGVILAGGENTRLPGKKKALRQVGSKVLLDTITQIFSSLFDEVFLVVRDPKDFCKQDLDIVTDIYPSKCALAGIHAGLFYSSNPYVFITACDTPFIKSNVIEYIVNQIEPGKDIIIPRTYDGYEPLSAVYSKNCIPHIEENLNKDIYMIKKFFRWRKVKTIEPDTLEKLDPDFRFMFNINTQEDLETAQLIYKRLEK